MKKRILVVDDERDIVELLRYNLVKEGYDVVPAYNGKEAIEKAAHPPDLVILDVMMPVLDGFEQALANAGTSDVAALIAGQAATARLLSKALEKAGIQEIVPTGQAFNPELHEAMTTQPAPDRPANTVLDTVQKGYLLNGRVLRPARVIVSRQA